jgi:putative hydrolase of the HAD superfamily
MNLKAIWFDFGGVLSPPIDDLFNEYHAKTGVSRIQMEAAMAEVARPMGVHPLAPIELAMLTQREWGMRMRQELMTLYPGIDLQRCDFDNHGDQWFKDHRANAGMIGLMKEAKALGFKVGILTNNVVEWEKPWRTMLDVDHLVDDIVDSCKVGARKPQTQIFELSAHRIGCSPGECLLIDDLEENCEAARACGWRAIVFRDNAQTEAELRALMGSATFA